MMVIIVFAAAWLAGRSAFLLAQNEESDYNYQYEQYTIAYQDFIRTRDEYKQYQTLASKDKLVSSLQFLLIRRVDTQRSYFLLLRQRMRTSLGLVVAEKNSQITYLTEEILFLENHKKRVTELKQPELQDLLDLSEELEDRSDDYYIRSYQVVGQLLLGKARDMLADTVSINSLLDQEMASYDNQKRDIYNAWLNESKSQALQCQTKNDTAVILLSELAKSKNKALENFNSVKILLQDEKIALDKAFSYQQELIGKITKI